LIRSTFIEFVDGTQGKGAASDHLFFIEKTASNGTCTYKLVKLFIPCIEKIKCWVYNHFSTEKRILIDHEKSVQWLRTAANELAHYDKNLEGLFSLNSLRSRAQSLQSIETQSHRHQRLLKQGMEKFHRATDLAKVIGKGTLKIAKQGYTPLKLHPEFIYEINQQKTEPLNAVCYVGPNERSAWAVRIEAGKLFRNEKIYVSSENKTLFQSYLDAFVIAPDKTLFAGGIELKKFHHSSFLAGGATIFAGELETDASGNITKITNRSGHYRPQKEHLLQALELFREWKIDLARVHLTEYSSARPELIHIYYSAERYLLCQGLCSPDKQIAVK
jgi:hypothetical protein